MAQASSQAAVTKSAKLQVEIPCLSETIRDELLNTLALICQIHPKVHPNSGASPQRDFFRRGSSGGGGAS